MVVHQEWRVAAACRDGGFEVFVTPDRKLEYQQHMPRVGVRGPVFPARDSCIWRDTRQPRYALWASLQQTGVPTSTVCSRNCG